MIKGVLFDFNGVLLLDTKWHEEAWNDLSLFVRKTPITQEESAIYIHGRTPKDTLEFLLGRPATPEESKELLDRKETLYQEVCLIHKDEFKLSAGGIKLFELLEQNSIKKTIATSSPKVLIDFYYKHLNLENWFPFVSTVYSDGSFPGKPAPDIFIKAAHNLGLAPQDCLVIEDAGSGVQAAKAAGVSKIILLVTDDNRHAAQSLEVDKKVASLSDITLKDLLED